MSLSLIKIWTFPIEVAEASLQQLVDKNYKIKTTSENSYIQIVSALTGQRHDFLDEMNNEIIADNFFLRRLEKAEQDGLSHDDILIRAIQESDNGDLKRIIKLQEKARLEEEDSKRLTLLENTYNEKIEDICPTNPHDSSGFYSTDPKTGEKYLLKAHHIFQYKEHCFDIDTIYRYVSDGGIIHLDADYVKRFFNKHGVVDFSGMKLTNESLKKKTYHEGVRTLKLDNNSITSLSNAHIPKTVTFLSVNNNPLKGGYHLKDETPNLSFLSMKDCDLVKVDFSYLPNSLTVVELNNNNQLIDIHMMKNMTNLRKLDIRNTGIKEINWDRFGKFDSREKLVLFCDEKIRFKHNRPDWIEVHHM